MRPCKDLMIYETVTAYVNQLGKHKVKNVYSKKRYSYYKDTTATFDIETTNNENDGFAYSFAFCIDGETIVLRYVEDVTELFDRLCEAWSIDEKHQLVIHVHNLGYEHMYTTQLFSEIYERKSILLTAARKALTVKYGNGIVFRDSLKLFQKSLAKTTEKVKHSKLVGDLDYRKYRTPDTFLNQTEYAYIVYDVVGLYEAIEQLKNEHSYNAATLPLTNTGMVIEAVNKYCNADKKCLKAMRDLTLDKHQLELAYKSMAGGDTHGCRWKSGVTFSNCNSNDFKSAHPSQQLLRDFPAGNPINLPGDTEESDLQMLIDNNYGWLGKVFISNFIIKNDCPNPTISYSKIEDISNNMGLDNGRLLGADGAILYMDSNDYQRFKQAYDYDDITLIDGFCFCLKPLPTAYKDAILHYFEQKENAEGFERAFAKICVNTIFGASAQKVIRDNWDIVDDGTLLTEHQTWEQTLAKSEEKEVYKKQQMKFPFLWGLWTASCTRLELFKMLKTIGWERVIYWDTDSCKYVGTKSTEIEKYNKGIKGLCKQKNAVIKNKKNEDVYIGIAEDEHKTVDYGYQAFRFLHAKCYAAESWNDKKQEYEFEITIAGVRKKEGADALKNCDNLREGFYIAKAGGNKLKYIDRLPQLRTDFERPTTTASYIVMSDRDYLIQA